MAKGAHSAEPAKRERKTVTHAIKKEQPDKSRRILTGKNGEQPAENAVASEEQGKKAARRAERIENAKAGSYRLLVAVTIVAAVVAIGLVALYFVGKNITEGDTNLPNVYVDGIHVGALTKEETEQLLISEGWVEANSKVLKVTIPRDISFEVDYMQSGASLTLEQAVNAAYSYGHDGSILNNVKTWITGFMKANDIGSSDRELNTELITAAVSGAIEKFNEANAAAAGYEVDMDSGLLKIDKGAGEVQLDPAELEQMVCESLLAGKTEAVYSPDVGLTEPDFSAILAELSVEPQDARYDKETDSIIKEVCGVSFDVNEAQKIFDSTPIFSVAEIPVELTVPEVSSKELEELLFRDILGEKATSLSGSSANRISNINLVAQKLDGLVLEPGEEFSYNDYIGERTEEAGFLGAPAYDDGQVIYQIGGGICQGSSTLYYCCLCADLEILDRTEHDFVVTYLPAGLDATVSYPRPDYKFRNSREYPIKIKAWVDSDENTLNIQIYGTNLTGEYVVPTSGRWATYDEVYTDVQTGWGAVSYRCRYDADGNLIEKVEEAYSVYQLHDEDIKWPAEYYQQQEAESSEGETAEEADPGTQEQSGGDEPAGTTDGNE